VEEQELIFKKFVRGCRAKSSAVTVSGIGLATCRVMARLLGGKVGIESRPDQGATFCLNVALPRRHVTRPTAVSPPVTAPSRREKWALVVDDQAYNLSVSAALLAELGYRTVCATDADTARAAMVKRTFDVVFLDIELPGVKGPEIARW